MRSKKRIISLLSLSLLMIGLFVYRDAAFTFIQDTLLQIRSLGAAGMAIYVSIYILATIAFLPGSIITLAGGFIYGPWIGTLLVSFSSVVGALCAFLLSRTLFSSWIQEKANNSSVWQKMGKLLEKNGLKFTILLRLSPLFPFNALNYLFGVSPVRAKDYVLGSFLGMLPATFLYVYMGSLLGSLSEVFAGNVPSQTNVFQKVLLGVGFIVTVVVVIIVTRMAKKIMKEELRA